MGRDRSDWVFGFFAHIFLHVYMIWFLHLVCWCFDGLFSLVCLRYASSIIRLLIPPQSLSLAQILRDSFGIPFQLKNKKSGLSRCPSMTPSVCWRRTCQSSSIKWGKLLRMAAPVMCSFLRLGHQKKFQRITMDHAGWLGKKRIDGGWRVTKLTAHKINICLQKKNINKSFAVSCWFLSQCIFMSCQHEKK